MRITKFTISMLAIGYAVIRIYEYPQRLEQHRLASGSELEFYLTEIVLLVVAFSIAYFAFRAATKKEDNQGTIQPPLDKQ